MIHLVNNVRTFPIPPVKENDVRIKLKASSFNPVDYKIRKGLFGGDFPMVLGHDGAGTFFLHIILYYFYFIF